MKTPPIALTSCSRIFLKDREALGALSAALNNWGGAVLIISHNKEFYSSVCKEEWNSESGPLTVEGASAERAMKAVAHKK